MVSRRNLLKGICSSAILGPIAAATAGCGDGQPDFTFTPFGNNPGSRRPNILLMMCDQLRTISSAYPTNTGEIPELREVMSFAKTLTPGNPYADLLRGFARLRKALKIFSKDFRRLVKASRNLITVAKGFETLRKACKDFTRFRMAW